ncbi:SEL1-like repeat protein [Ruminococcus albus]|uniref:TPR repeat n=1 Tax=Ruminococcus albus TaxID=1264 RepID=A0A1H7LGK6_RUMAL|nr:tetratricopeptide repeat protein [Ruminococcus albus]SEK97968.1 TPR repeat [Ruminococcus albus]
MAKKIRFPLKINDTDVRSIEDLRDNFDLETVLGYYTNGKLVTWLRDRYYNEEADSIEALSADDEQLGIKLAKALGVEIEADENLDIEEVRLRREKLEMLSRYISDRKILDNMDIVAVDQDDLYDILDSGADKVYLFKETFSVPTRRGDVTYIGLNGAKVKLQGKTDYDFNAVNIHFDNVEFTGSNDPEEYCNIANCYYDGNGVSENYDKMYEYYKKAADMGYAEAEAYVGMCYLSGNGVSESDFEAMNWFKKSAERGCGLGYYGMADCYLNGYGVEKDENEALKWYSKAHDQGVVRAAKDIAEMYDNQENYREAIKWYEKYLNHGNKVTDEFQDEVTKYVIGECYFKIGEQYRNSNSEDRLINALENYKIAYDYYNSYDAFVKLGECCIFESFPDAYKDEKSKWYTLVAEKYGKAANDGNMYIASYYGAFYYYGLGVPKDYQKAIEWFQKSYDYNPFSMYKLGDCYFYGNGVEENYYEAAKWYKKAADQGYEKAYTALADCYCSDGSMEDLDEAEYWFEKAIDAGIDRNGDFRLCRIDCIIQLKRSDEQMAGLINYLKGD